MPDLTPAETLRSAAKLMRERAGAATPGPWAWEHTGQKDSSWALGLVQTEDGGDLSGEIAPGSGVVIDGVCESINGNPADAAHIAGMHPGLAVAVADWLNNSATDAADAYEHGGRWRFSQCDSPAGIAAALKIARAYLGESPDA